MSREELRMSRRSTKPAEIAAEAETTLEPAPPESGATVDGVEVDKRLVITLGVEAANATRRLAAHLGVTPIEAVRRGLTLLDLLVSLDPDEELIVRNRKTGQTDRLRFHWGY
jgi:hypothetical protein